MPPIESLAELSAARPLRRFEREIAALGGKTVCFRELDGDALALVIGVGRRYTAAQRNPDGTVSFDFTKDEMVEILSHSLCNSAGELIAAGEGGQASLRGLHWQVLNEMFAAGLQALGLSGEAVEEKKAG